MYLSTRTRPDIAFVVSALACRVERPKQSDWERLVHLAKYLNGTKDECLLFKYGGQIELSAFVDASFMTHRDMRGHTGYCIFADRIGSAAILYRSVKQKSVATRPRKEKSLPCTNSYSISYGSSQSTKAWASPYRNRSQSTTTINLT